jgi:hypothetical protein
MSQNPRAYELGQFNARASLASLYSFLLEQQLFLTNRKTF